MHYILTDKTLTFIHEGKPHSIHKANNDRTWHKAMELLEKRDAAGLYLICDSIGALTKFFPCGVKIVEGVLYANGEKVETYVARRAMGLVRSGLPVEPLLKFIVNLQLNPSERALGELYQFLEHGDLPITEDGCFMAYKAVHRNGDDTFVDAYTKTMSNNVGDVVSMPRAEVDADPNQTCSRGLHVCSYDYLSFYSHTDNIAVLMLKVHPKDVVAVPTDYNNTKMRVCEYEVIAELETPENLLVQHEIFEWKGDDDDFDDDDLEEEWEDEDHGEDGVDGVINNAITDYYKDRA